MEVQQKLPKGRYYERIWAIQNEGG